MKQGTIPDFIVIDDDNFHNLLCQKIIELTIPASVVHTFNEPEKGLEYIQSTYSGSDAGNAILFLDINMPSLTGWEVLNKIKNLPGPVKEHVKIFMLSSSVDPQDKEISGNNPLVSGYIEKFLSQVKLQAIFPEYVKMGVG